ncbi:MAG: methyltransferase domain-containing protein [Nitrososphaerales archaeon]
MNYPDAFFTFIFDRGCFHSVKAEHRDKFVKGVHRVLKKNGKYYMMCFSWRNGAVWNHFTEDDIRRYFSHHFKILETKEDVFIENVSSRMIYFYSTLMEAKDI